MIKKMGVYKDYSDESIKSVFEVEPKKVMEMTLLSNSEVTDVVCVPTHYNCNLGCRICHFDDMKVNESMESVKAIDFMKCLIETLTIQGRKRTNKKSLLISFSGIGDPLLNIELIEQVYNLESILKEQLDYDMITYSLITMMPNDNIVKLTELVNELNIPLKLGFALHTPFKEDRAQLLPKVSIDLGEALDYLQIYSKTIYNNKVILDKVARSFESFEPVEIYYSLIKNVNDGKKELHELCRILEQHNFAVKFWKFNLIDNLDASSKALLWKDKILQLIPAAKVQLYDLPGKEINKFNGHLINYYKTIENKDEKEEFEKWRQQHEVLEQQRLDNLSWDEYFMAVAKLSAMRSKDPNTQVGACIVSDDNRILSIGYNGTPNGYLDERFFWQRVGNPLETKYMYVVHAERNAILNYRGNRRDFENAKIYVDLFPCNECAKEIIQAGIKQVIYLSDKYADTPENIASKKLFDMCGVSYRQLEQEHQKKLVIDLNNFK